ncbi:DNA gyrase subunit ParC [Pontimonas salivibrio]|uniref:DNA topoisomerase (ATP-hydrolyzing) n=1 Tax=Pontimonas salivibrio TaxID=1159327 RepID=A0A2L2BQG3_9MICO|nr:DNA topoisomerase IV subunit A [Pontimonas salivibrio]AVG23904.1 DNA gyrase subunit ParC [Pontimonas salivibrio]
MTPPPSPPAPTGRDHEPDDRIVDIDLSDEMSDSFLEYAYSVIYQRALPDARDGLKPVQRRILYQMAQMGLLPERGHVKSARVVGEVMGKLHPHGDSAIYDALVRLAQPFTMRVPFVDGHGNFGSPDDGPAAARYTEARLREEAVQMVGEIDEDVVDFVPNYDNQLTQPSVLPAAIPALLVNGASGIAVGMATNMAPHNLGEVINAARHLIDHPDASTEELMGFVPGPDLPGGGIIVGTEGIAEAYQVGRGSFKTRARVSIEQVGPRSQGLVVTELPYLVGPERVIEKIKDGVINKKIQGISDVNDLTDRQHGLRLVITVKSGFDPQLVLQALYRLTPLEESFSINNVALVEGQPRTMGLRELLQVYIDHRISVTTRRSTFRLGKKRDRLHLVEGLLIAIVDIDEVIHVIRSSDDSAAAKATLQSVFDLTEIQAEYILELRLRRLTKFSRIELETERDELVADIEALEALLADPQAIRDLVGHELGETSRRFDSPRRTEIRSAEDEPVPTPKATRTPTSLERQDAPCVLILTATGLAARIDGDEFTTPRARLSHDALLAQWRTSTRSPVGVVLSDGQVITVEPGEFPALSAEKITPKDGVDLAGFVGADKGVRVLGAFPLGEKAPVIALGTRQGVVKRVELAALPQKTSQHLISLKPDDQVVGVGMVADEDWLCFITDDAQLLRFPAQAVRPQGPSAGGMTGISLSEGHEVISFHTAYSEDAQVVTISSSSSALSGVGPGRAKVTALQAFPPKGRATKGVRAHAFLKGEDILTSAAVAMKPLALSAGGRAVELPEPTDKRDGSGSVLPATVGHVGNAPGLD